MGGEGHSIPGRPPRMKNLGTISSSQSCYNFLIEHGINNGTFKDIELGDIVTITHPPMTSYNKSTYTEWWVAGLDWKYNSVSSTQSDCLLSSHHICLFGKSIQNTTGNFPMAPINATSYASTKEGYRASSMSTVTLPNISGVLESTLNTYLLPKKYTIPHTFNKNLNSMYGLGRVGAESNVYEVVYKAQLLTENELIGDSCFSSAGNENLTSGILPLFRILPFHYWNYSKMFWTRSHAYDEYYICAHSRGTISIYQMHNSLSVLPIIFIG